MRLLLIVALLAVASEAGAAACADASLEVTGDAGDTRVFQPCTITSIPSQSWTTGQAVSLNVNEYIDGCGDGAQSVAWSLDGSEPGTVAISASDGTLSGSVSTEASGSFFATCTNSVGSESALVTYAVTDTSAVVLFSETFDAQPVTELDGKCKYAGDPECAVSTPVPSGWSYFYTGQENPTNPACEIVTEEDYEGSGKSFKVWDESYGTDSRWGHDCQLAKFFYTQYPEMWISLYIKFNASANVNDLNAAKIFRMGHYNPSVEDGTYGTSLFNTNNSNVPNGENTTSGLAFYDVKSGSPYDHKFSVRCFPDYKCGTYDDAWEISFKDENGVFADGSWSGTYGDGQWHHFEVGMIMNSSPGAGDGEIHLYYDGVYQGGRNNVPWRNGTQQWAVTGFNMATIAGNATNVWAGNIENSSSPEQVFYYIDNVRICTERCP